MHNIGASANPDVALNRLWELTLLLTEDMEQWLGEHGLTVARAALMWELDELGPETQRALSEALHVSPRNVTGLVDALEAGDFVTRAPHPTDRRATLVTLTDKGRAIAGEMREGQGAFARTLFGDIPPADLTAFIDTLDHVLERVRSAAAGPGEQQPDGPSPDPQ